MVQVSAPAVTCAGLSKAFGPVRAVDQLDLEVSQGEILTLLGPSGCGKTTTLRLIAGFETPDSGSVEIGGAAVARPGFSLPPEKRHVGLVFQDYALFPHLSVGDNVQYGLSRSGRREGRMEEVLSAVGLDGTESRYPHELSGGQQQRVALARALAPEPRILLLDEPLSNLDAGLRLQVRNEMKGALKSSGVTVVWVTHDQEEALAVGDTVAIINAGRVEQMGDPETVFHRPATTFVAHFLGTADFITARRDSGDGLTELGRLPLTEGATGESRLELMVRPDDIECAPSEAGRGTVVARAFQGMAYLYRIRLSSGELVHALRPHTEKYDVGTRVAVAFDAHYSPSYFVDGRAVTDTLRPSGE